MHQGMGLRASYLWMRMHTEAHVQMKAFPSLTCDGSGLRDLRCRARRARRGQTGEGAGKGTVGSEAMFPNRDDQLPKRKSRCWRN